MDESSVSKTLTDRVNSCRCVSEGEKESLCAGIGAEFGIFKGIALRDDNKLTRRVMIVWSECRGWKIEDIHEAK